MDEDKNVTHYLSRFRGFVAVFLKIELTFPLLVGTAQETQSNLYQAFT